jgi:hypothetical protein
MWNTFQIRSSRGTKREKTCSAFDPTAFVAQQAAHITFPLRALQLQDSTFHFCCVRVSARNVDGSPKMSPFLADLQQIRFAAFAQENFKCPDDFGFYPHHSSCDKYWKCDNNVAELKTCGNGLAFDASDPKFLTENCDYIHNVDCGDRTQLGKSPVSLDVGSLTCPLQSHRSPPLTASACTASSPTRANATSSGTVGTVKPPGTSVPPDWPTTARRASACGPIKSQNARTKVIFRIRVRKGVTLARSFAEVAGGFSCPAPGEVSNSGSFSRHAHPDDCRKYYICLEGTAREYGCPIGTVFKIGDADGTGNCEDPEDVPGW